MFERAHVLVKTLRWLLLPLLLAALLWGAVGAGQRYVDNAAQRCAHAVGGACVEGWHTTVIERVIYTGVVVTPLALTLLAGWVAPNLKRLAAGIAALLCAGLLLVGFLMTSWPELLPPAAVAGVAGLCGFLLVWYWQRPTSKAGHESLGEGS